MPIDLPIPDLSDLIPADAIADALSGAAEGAGTIVDLVSSATEGGEGVAPVITPDIPLPDRRRQKGCCCLLAVAIPFCLICLILIFLVNRPPKPAPAPKPAVNPKRMIEQKADAIKVSLKEAGKEQRDKGRELLEKGKGLLKKYEKNQEETKSRHAK